MQRQPACGARRELIPLRPKPLAVLVHLVAHAGDVVSKEALLDAVWPETAVSDDVLRSSIRPDPSGPRRYSRRSPLCRHPAPQRLPLHRPSNFPLNHLERPVLLRRRSKKKRLTMPQRQWRSGVSSPCCSAIWSTPRD